MTGDAAVRLHEVRKVFGRGEGAVHALRGVSVEFEAGAFTAVMGPSGSGKTTLMQCAAGLERVTAGRIAIGGREITVMAEAELARLRRARVGFVFQSFNLVSSLSARRNVELPLRLAGRRPNRAEVAHTLELVGLGDRLRHRPAQLSGGQQQRVAIARALVTRPAVLFADEPTGALDTATGHQILALLRHAVDQAGQTVVMVTHDPSAAARADRVIYLADGRLQGEQWRPTAGAIAEQLTKLGA